MEYTMIKEGDYDWERKGDPITFVIEESAEIEREPAEDIQQVLEARHYDSELAQMGEEQPFDEEAHYAETDVDVAESQASWFHFERVLKTQARYFSRTAEETLSPVHLTERNCGPSELPLKYIRSLPVPTGSVKGER